jgi:hypothetical protein
MWLIESLGPFLTLASPSHQTFGHLLNSLNFTVPHQSQKLSGAPALVVGGFSSVFSTVQLTALMRFLITDVVAQWCGHFKSPSEEAEILPSETIIPSSKLVLSLSTSLVGDEALRAVCNLNPLNKPIRSDSCLDESNNSPKASSGRGSRRMHTPMPRHPSHIPIDILVRVVECFDGLSILSSFSDPSVRKLLGFIPLRAVTCFPGSVLSTCASSDIASVNGFGWIGSNVAGLWSSKSCLGGLYSLATELFEAVLLSNEGQKLLKNDRKKKIVKSKSKRKVCRCKK